MSASVSQGLAMGRRHAGQIGKTVSAKSGRLASACGDSEECDRSPLVYGSSDQCCTGFFPFVLETDTQQ